MSYDSIGGSAAECELLRRNGFHSSPFESGSSDGRYHGHWTHSEMPKGMSHMSTKEALQWLRERQESIRGQSEVGPIGHTSSDFSGQ